MYASLTLEAHCLEEAQPCNIFQLQNPPRILMPGGSPLSLITFRFYGVYNFSHINSSKNPTVTDFPGPTPTLFSADTHDSKGSHTCAHMLAVVFLLWPPQHRRIGGYGKASFQALDSEHKTRLLDYKVLFVRGERERYTFTHRTHTRNFSRRFVGGTYERWRLYTSVVLIKSC